MTFVYSICHVIIFVVMNSYPCCDDAIVVIGMIIIMFFAREMGIFIACYVARAARGKAWERNFGGGVPSGNKTNEQ